MPFSHASLAIAVITVLLAAGIAAWGYVFLSGLRHYQAVTPGVFTLRTILGDADFRQAHRNHLHFAEVCFFGAAAVAVSLDFSG